MPPREFSFADVDRLVSQFLAAWNERDPNVRWRHLQATWADDGAFEDAVVRIDGRLALDRHITRCQAQRPGCRFVVTEPPAQQHGRFQLTWTMLDEAGRELLTGSDFGEIDGSGRISRLTAFVRASACVDRLAL